MFRNFPWRFWAPFMCFLLAFGSHLTIEFFVGNNIRGARATLLFSAFFVLPLFINLIRQRAMIFYSILTNALLIVTSVVSFYTRNDSWNSASKEFPQILTVFLFGILCAVISSFFLQRSINFVNK